MSRYEIPLPMVDASQQSDSGREYWRSLEELAASEQVQELVQEQFPQATSESAQPLSRRQFLLLGASIALAGATGCSTAPPRERILPYVDQPEEIVPGEPMYYATSMTLGGYASGLLVKSVMGRPIKVEGNPDHPANPQPIDSPQHARFGPTDLFAQASMLTMYDPDRSQSVKHLNDISIWERFASQLLSRVESRDSVRLRLLTESVTSPTLANQIQEILQRFPRARWHVHDAVSRDSSDNIAQQVFGEAVDLHYRFDRADVVLSLESDFLSCGSGQLRYVHDFISRRRVQTAEQRDGMNRLYAVENMPTLTGAKADHRWPLRSVQIESFARALAGRLGVNVPGEAPEGHGLSDDWIRHLADDLNSHQGRSIVIAGNTQSPIVHAIAQKLNETLGNFGETVIPTNPVSFQQDAHSLVELVTDMDEGQVDVLLILEGNPVYTAPADLDFAAKLDRVPFRAHLSLYDDETSARCHWHIPATHFLESWGDARSRDGTVSMVQPLISPLYDGKSAYEVLTLLSGRPDRRSYDIVRSNWRSVFCADHPLREYWENLGLTSAFSGNFEQWWRRSLHAGFVANTSLPEKRVSVREDWHQVPQTQIQPGRGNDLEVVFRPDPTIYDGRFANNGWLQELPKPLTKLTWENAAFMSPATAVRLRLAPEGEPQQANGKIARLRYRGRNVEAPAFVIPGHANDSVTLHLGYGRTRSGNVGANQGFDAYRLRTSAAPWFDRGLSLVDTGRRTQLATTQHHHLIENHGFTGDRHLIWSSAIDDYQEMADQMRHHYQPLPSLYPERENEGRKWGMSIDVNSCTGCSACVVACQSENNIPIVGKDEVARGRELHWLRIDTYYTGNPQRPATLETFHQPVPCMHCENAPCEVVCPVEATVHSSDGLNDMIYNRCVGTRYCSNNCPYKVRRFNFLQYADWETETYRLMRNPEVTVRSRGVMEKCTYCVQRIRTAEIAAGREERSVRDGEIQTACQAACPSGAIVFGDLNQRGSKVAEQQGRAINYSLLHEHNTRPRTTYLAALRNPNPSIHE